MGYFITHWRFVLLLGSAILVNSHILAEGTSFPSCKTSLRHFSLHLEECSKQMGSQPYYESLYQQVKDFLEVLETFPTDAEQINKCENFLKVLHDIVGKHSGSQKLESIPGPPDQSISRGKLTSPTLETTPKRPLCQPIRYVYNDGTPFEKKTTDEDEGLMEHLPVSPTFSPKTKKAHIKKDIEFID